MKTRLLSLLLFGLLLLSSAAFAADSPPAQTAAAENLPAASSATVQVYPPDAKLHNLVVDLSGTDHRLPNEPASASPLPAQAQIQPVHVEDGYAVVVSRATYEDAAWHEVVKALSFKYHAPVIVYSGAVAEARQELARQMPRYACFVARPEEAGREFVISIHRMTRTLNDDPYTDVIWGILTGYRAADALRIVAQNAPLVIHKGAGGTSIPLNLFDQGVWYDEGRKNHAVQKAVNGKIEDKQCADDTTHDLVNVFNQFQPDLFVTSGHASERAWQIGYSYPDGFFICKNGELLGVDTQHHAFPIHSANPKVYLPVGNCLMGHIQDDQSMALAFMGSGGVDQMFGYVVETWYGYGGWGILNYFLDQPGRFNLAESFYLNNQSLVYQIGKRFPASASFNIDDWNTGGLEKIANHLGYTQWNDAVKDNVGMLWDRDTVAFYGDPAWDARMATHPEPWDQKLTVKGNIYTFELKASKDVNPPRPPAVLFPHRLKNIYIEEGKALQPVVTSNFLMLPQPTHLEAGKTYRVVFTAARA